MTQEINIFLPMRAGSQRVKRKNTRQFSDIRGGLCQIKLEQLLSCPAIGKIVVSTDDATVVEIARNFNSQRISVLHRPVALATSEASTDDLIRHASEVMPDGHILWTHVTSPFVNSSIYDDIIKTYRENLSQFDSLMTVTRIQKFIWNEERPINYDGGLEKWPRTQTLKPIWEVNSACFLTSKEIYKRRFDRIGENPFLFELDQEIAYDIDWPADFRIAEAMYSSLRMKNHCSLDNSVPIIANKASQNNQQYTAL